MTPSVVFPIVKRSACTHTFFREPVSFFTQTQRASCYITGVSQDASGVVALFGTLSVLVRQKVPEENKFKYVLYVLRECVVSVAVS